MFFLVAQRLLQTGYVKLGQNEYEVKASQLRRNSPPMDKPAHSDDEDKEDSFSNNSPVRSPKSNDHSPEGPRSTRSVKKGEEAKELTASDSDESESASNTIEVHNLPEDQKEQSLWMFLENKKRSGGGKITELKLDSSKRTAVVQFNSQEGSIIFCLENFWNNICIVFII